MGITLTDRTWVWIVALAVISAVLGRWYYVDSRSRVVLRPEGKATFYRGGLFHQEKFDLTLNRGRWLIQAKDSLEGGELIVPFECEYNKHRTLRLEDGGKVYLLDRKTATREELRVVDGEWSYNADDHWQSVFDLDIYGE